MCVHSCDCVHKECAQVFVLRCYIKARSRQLTLVLQLALEKLGLLYQWKGTAKERGKMKWALWTDPESPVPFLRALGTYFHLYDVTLSGMCSLF